MCYIVVECITEREGNDMTNNLEIAKRIIKKHFKKAHSGIWNRRTLFKVKPLYKKDGLEIDICYFNDGHFEVFGLSGCVNPPTHFCSYGERKDKE